ncbi:MAG: chemotaxis-specific protein-glutamate methyltransferase CheB [Pseudomonadales bacterium]|jgi:two-component system chemotaxis response regulator CheB|nr:chemotaxis-specific protein-glutamate methyltransferase CheB [Pseudomonadales bacterium]
MTSAGTPKTVLVVDDSVAMCQFLQAVLDADPELTVVGTANNAYEARDLIKRLNPDVITLDIEMPYMDGLTFLRNLMRLHPMPVVIISSLTAAGADLTLEALNLGAVDALVKRHPGAGGSHDDYLSDIRRSVRIASGANISAPHTQIRKELKNPNLISWRKKVLRSGRLSERLKSIIAIGSSTGGPQALSVLLQSFANKQVGILAVQHMPERFLASLARRLDAETDFSVELASHGRRLDPGTVLLAPGDTHMVLAKVDAEFYTHLKPAAGDEPHVPAVEELFQSISRTAGSGAIGVLLTGMGNDGAEGMRAMHDRGSLTLVQDQATSAVWGMPGQAVALRAVDGEIPLPDFGATLNRVLD